MNKIMKATSALVFFALASGSQAGDFSYTYIEGGMNHYNYDEIDQSFEINGSLAIDSNIHIIAGYRNTDLKTNYAYADIGVPITIEENGSIEQQQIGIGTHFPTSPETDIVIEASYIKVDLLYEAEAYNNQLNLHASEGTKVSLDGVGLSASIRHKLTEKLEGNASISHNFLDEGFDETTFGVGGRLYFNENISAGLDYSTTEDEDMFRSSLRLGTL